MNSSTSPIAQFRSKVQWYLNSNTPALVVELHTDLLIAIKLLSAELAQESFSAVPAVSSFVEFSNSLTATNFKDSSKVYDCVNQLNVLVTNVDLKLAERKSFRNTAVQLILLAEGNSDREFKKVVLNFAKSIQ